MLDPVVLLQELADLKAQGGDGSGLRISNRAHVVLPYHKIIDGLQEQFKGSHKVGTTGRGIGPCYADAADRIGIRVVSWMDPKQFAVELKEVLNYKNRLLTEFYKTEPLSFDKIYEEYCGYADQLRPFVCDTSALANRLLKDDKKVLFEGAQAAMLDLSHGTYPFVTSSHPTAGAICTGIGIGPHAIGKIIGVVKAYGTRVGEGPFPTELTDETGSRIREIAHEYGATTGRPRRCGWLDACVVKYAAQINGLDCIALTRLDILDTFSEIKLCVAYKLDGKILDEFPASLEVLSRVEPVYESFPGWLSSTCDIKNYADLPQNCRRYIERLSEVIDTRIGIVSVGPERERTILCESMF